MKQVFLLAYPGRRFVTFVLLAMAAMVPQLVATAQSNLSSARHHSCLVDGSGNLFCWGANDRGQLGDGSRVDRTQPIRVDPPQVWATVATGDGHSCATRTDGGLWCWGDNRKGQLGQNTTVGLRTQPVRVPVSGGSGWVAVAVGDFHSCALHAESGANAKNSLWCWGQNTQGQLGIGSYVDQTVPTKLPGDNQYWTVLAAGKTHNCAIEERPNATDNLFCWGSNERGQLGSTNLEYKNTPQAVTGPPAVTGQWQAVSSGSGHNCGLLLVQSKLSLYCWGADTEGQLGDGGSTDSSTLKLISDPVESDTGTPTSVPWRMVSAGDRHSCALTSSNHLYCWGANERGQLGLNNNNSNSQPARSPVIAVGSQPGQWLTVAAGGSHSCGLDTFSSVWCWGQRLYGQIGDALGKLTGSEQPEHIAVDQSWQVVPGTIAAADDAVCAINQGGQLWCWGEGSDGQIGDGGGISRLKPLMVSAAASDSTNNVHWTQVSVGGYTSCGLKDSGTAATDPKHTLWCWGRTSVTEQGASGASNQTTPVQLTPPMRPVGDTSQHKDWISLAQGEQHGCAVAYYEQPGIPKPANITPHRYLYCWGNNRFGQLGLGSAVVEAPLTQVGVADNWQQVSSGTRHSCAVDRNSKLYCWGDNSKGQLGLGGGGTRFDPTRVGNSSDWQLVQAGGEFSCALKINGSLWCWGANDGGQLGLSGFNFVTSPQQVGTATNWRQISLGANHVCAVRTDNSLWCWGNGNEHQLALAHNSAVPARAATGPVWATTAVGQRNSCAVKQSGELYCWGNNFYGQMGNTTAWEELPRKSLSINDVTVTEGDSGTVTATFTVTLSAASGQMVTVNYASADGTAVAPGDYTAVLGTLTFNPGVTTQTIQVVVKGDILDEEDETFSVNLSAPVNASLGTASATGTITDDDPGVATAFTFIERTNIPVNTFVTSESKTMSGYGGSLPISVSGGNTPQYGINGGAFTGAAGSISAGDTLVVRHVSANSVSTATTTTVTVGSYSTPFKSVTTTLDRVPDPFDFGTQTGVSPGAVVESVVVTLTGFDTGTAIVPGPDISYRINGGAYTTATGTLQPGQTLQVKHTANANHLGYTKTYLRVGGVTGYFLTRTQ